MTIPDDILCHSIRTRLNGFSRIPPPEGEWRQAAVAVVVAGSPETGEASVIVTLRPSGLNRHGGQYALPGGRLDPGETIDQAALRELHEELGLELGAERILGHLDPFATRSGFIMSPVVVWAGANVTLHPDPGEVAETFHLPFSELDSPDIPRLLDSEHGDQPVLSAYFPTLGHYMYAPTAAVIYQFREVAIHGRATRVAHFDQPRFAWK
ncbi:NUDIX hydrolase [Lutimaribacter marinistellae]|uniref:NUDIX hydrolase n=1 Tax=Lutimaribacter marinistellae TaxID=1820329 RepID=A0ABV7TBI2_9RHOB